MFIFFGNCLKHIFSLKKRTPKDVYVCTNASGAHINVYWSVGPHLTIKKYPLICNQFRPLLNSVSITSHDKYEYLSISI